MPAPTALTLPLTPTSPSMDTHLRQSIDAIAKSGYLTADVTTGGVQASVGQRLTSVWSVGGWAGLTWDGRKEAGLRVKGVW